MTDLLANAQAASALIFSYLSTVINSSFQIATSIILKYDHAVSTSGRAFLWGKGTSSSILHLKSAMNLNDLDVKLFFLPWRSHPNFEFFGFLLDS